MELRKICLIGDFAVGKTSLVRRFVSDIYSIDYLTTIGVKVETRIVELPRKGAVKLVIWDMAGSNSLSTVAKNYLQGASGYLLVVDGTRKETLESALHLKTQVDTVLQSPPSFGLLNKCDLKNEWDISESFVQTQPDADYWRLSSALSGEAVEQAFVDLALATR